MTNKDIRPKIEINYYQIKSPTSRKATQILKEPGQTRKVRQPSFTKQRNAEGAVGDGEGMFTN